MCIYNRCLIYEKMFLALFGWLYVFNVFLTIEYQFSPLCSMCYIGSY